MMHIIIGSGVVGQATGKWLIANNEDVIFNDINEVIVKKLIKNGYNATTNIEKNIDLKKVNVYWICTAEWNTEEALKKAVKCSSIKNDAVFVIRSTTLPGTTKHFKEKYNIKFIAHNPEFLRESSAVFDMFHPDRVVIGTDSSFVLATLTNVYKTAYSKIVKTDSTSSEIIKLASNCWLATQISYWNEIKKICEKFKVNSQNVANVCTLDKRISKYGTNMLGTSYGGFCLPKDLKALSNLFKEKDLYSEFLHLVSKVNKEGGEEK